MTATGVSHLSIEELRAKASVLQAENAALLKELLKIARELAEDRHAVREAHRKE